MEPEGSLLQAHQPTNCVHPEPF